MKRDGILFVAGFVAAFGLFGAVLFHNRSGGHWTRPAPTPPSAPWQQTVTPVETANPILLEESQRWLPKPDTRHRPVYRIVSCRGDNRLIPDLRGLNVNVFADSISCERLARSVLRLNGVIESSPRPADVVLVVTRSSFSNPLNSRYGSLSDLKRDSETLLSISGPNGHIYVFSIDDEMQTADVFHTKFKWDDYQFGQ